MFNCHLVARLSRFTFLWIRSKVLHIIIVIGRHHNTFPYVLCMSTTYLSPCMLTEIGGVSRITEACDWWSLGALLFELLTGMVSLHARNIFSISYFCTLHLDFPLSLLSVPAAAVAAPPSRDPLPHPAAHPQSPERCRRLSAHWGQTSGFSSEHYAQCQYMLRFYLTVFLHYAASQLLQFDAGYRLGSGGGGVSDIKCHPFFSSVSWKALSC